MLVDTANHRHACHTPHHGSRVERRTRTLLRGYHEWPAHRGTKHTAQPCSKVGAGALRARRGRWPDYYNMGIDSSAAATPIQSHT